MLNGILKVPSEISFGADEAGVDDDPEENAFLADCIDHIIGAIENAGYGRGGRLPSWPRAPPSSSPMLEWMETHDPATDYMEQAPAQRRRSTALAIGLDMPPEILKGLSDANHWAARQIMHDAWRSHGASIAEQFCDDLAEAYLRPALRESERRPLRTEEGGGRLRRGRRRRPPRSLRGRRPGVRSSGIG